MRMLSRDGFDRARRFLATQARPIERAEFAHRFEGAPAERVVDELVRFQNPDGGIGHALEPDLRSPSSSALATGIGLAMLVDLGCPPEHPAVRSAVAYLLDSLDPETGIWRVAPADTHSFPHAPWWHDESGSLAPRFDGFRIIPRAQILASLHHYSALVPADRLDHLTSETVRHIEEVEVLGEGGGSDLQYAIRLAEAEHLAPCYAARLEARIRASIPRVVVGDSARWESYCLSPLRVVSTPNSMGIDLIRGSVERHLDYQIDHQTPEGAWEPAWSWGGAFPDAWAQARVEWCGKLTMETLAQLDAFGRIEPLG